MTNKKYYARKNGYGVRCSSESQGWHAYRFDSAEERQTWIDAQNTDGRFEDVAEKCTKREALKIAGCTHEEHVDYKNELRPY